MSSNIWAAVEKIPPVACRLMARKNRGRTPMTNSEIALVAKLPPSTVAEISLRTTWSGVSIDVVERFARACGVNHLAARRQIEWFKRSKVTRYSRGNQGKFFVRLIKIAATLTKTPKSPVELPPASGPSLPSHSSTP